MAALFAYTADKPIGPLLVVASSTGLRQGECLALRWDDLDLEAGTLRVQHTLNPHTQELAPTKTALSRREVHLPAAAVTALHEQRRRQLEERLRTGRRWKDAGFVFATRVGTPRDSRGVSRQYHAARVALGLPDLPFHHLRHFAASALLAAGEDLFTVSRILGHSSVATRPASMATSIREAPRGCGPDGRPARRCRNLIGYGAGLRPERKPLQDRPGGAFRVRIELVSRVGFEPST